MELAKLCHRMAFTKVKRIDQARVECPSVATPQISTAYKSVNGRVPSGTWHKSINTHIRIVACKAPSTLFSCW